MFQECFQDILRVFQGKLWGDPFKGVSRYLKGVQWVFEGRFQDVSTMFQGSFQGVSRKIEGSSESPLRVIKWRFKVCKRSSRGVSRQFHGV